MNSEINDKRFTKILFTQKEIEDKIYELSQWVNNEYKNSNNLLLVSILKGSIPFLAQLIKNVTVDHAIDFMTVSSYKGQQQSIGNIKIVMDLACDISGKDVLIVEDIVDSGISLEKIKENLKGRKPKSIKILTLLNKPEGRKIDLEVDKYGFIVPNEFLAGFGLDVKDKLRNLPYIGIFNKKYFDEI
ncbi:MAG: hypoxanthine phosphoribosyltransferase [Metamycoplasmataceae bacterium]